MHTDNTHSRLFLALPIPEAISRELSSFTDAYLPSHTRRIAPVNYHITLHFLADVDKKMQKQLETAISAERWRCINEIRLHGTDAFPHILYASVASNAALQSLHDRLGTCLRAIGLAPEQRAYTPHITLARAKQIGAAGQQQWLNAGKQLPALFWQPSHFCLYKSHLSHKGATYEILQQWPLTNG